MAARAAALTLRPGAAGADLRYDLAAMGQLEARMKRFVESQIRSRGAEYFHDGRVTIEAVTGGEVSARVEGSREYIVTLTVDGETLRAECDCPYFTREAEACKHVWAVILVVDRRGVPGGRMPARLALEGDADEAAPGFDDDAGDWDDEGAPPSRPRSADLIFGPWGSRLPSRRAKGSDWKELLGSVPAVEYEPPGLDDYFHPEGEFLYYLISNPDELASGATVVAEFTRPKKSGGRTIPRTPSGYLPQHAHRLPHAIDREIFAICSGGPYGTSGWFTISAAAVPYALPILCRSGRFRMREGSEPVALTLDEGPAWSFSVKARKDERGLAIEGFMIRDADARPVHELAALFESGLFVAADGALSRFELPVHDYWLRVLRGGAIRVPKREEESFVAAMLSWRHVPPIELPAELSWNVREGVPRPRLALSAPATQAWPPPRRVELSFEYEGRIVREDDPLAAIVAGPREAIRRNSAVEGAARQRLLGLGVRRDHFTQRLEIEASRCGSMVPALLAEGWHVEVGGKLHRVASSHSISVTSGIDWFDVEGSADYDGVAVGFPALLAAMRSGASSVELSDGTIGELPGELVRLSSRFLSFGEAEGGRIRFRKSQAALLDALLASRPEVTVDAAFGKLRERLRGFGGVAPIEAPKGFEGSLRVYQKEALGWFEFLREMGFGGCLADDMGLGKTVQVLALLESRRAARGRAKTKPSLVVVPRSLVFNWIAEAERFTPRLRVVDHTGLDRAQGRDLRFEGADLVLTTYGTLRRDAEQLSAVAWDYAILDESQAIKNASTQAAKAARLLRAEHRLALSGTPIENHLGELWSLFEFLNPGMLGVSRAFRDHLAGGKGTDPEARERISRLVRPFILRRTKEQVAKELPKKTEQTIWCELEGAQRKLYDELRDHYRAALLGRIGTQGIAKSKIQVLEALLRLRQAACHPRLVNERHAKAGSAKLDELMSRLVELSEEGHKVLVFSQFTSMLAIVREELDARKLDYCYLDGATRDRGAVVERFRKSAELPIFLISLKAGGLGLNLVEAEYVILLDPWWNPAVEAQAIDRAHRIGQTRHVFAYRLVARDTVEEKILELQKSKRELADAILGEDKSLIAGLRTEDIEFLLS